MRRVHHAQVFRCQPGADPWLVQQSCCDNPFYAYRCRRLADAPALAVLRDEPAQNIPDIPVAARRQLGCQVGMELFGI